MTNARRKTRADLLLRLKRLGIAPEPERVYAAPLAARDWLAERELRPHLLTHPALAADFEGLETERPNAVFVLVRSGKFAPADELRFKDGPGRYEPGILEAG